VSSAKIEYRHHPFFGTEVKVVRTLRRFGEAVDIVELPRGSRIAVPRWMLDPVRCRPLPEEAKPRLSLKSLLSLAELLERLPVHFHTAVSGTSPSTKGKHVSESIDRVSSTVTASSQEDSLESIAGSESNSMPASAGQTAASSGARKSEGKE
jgi:hypothetical protein